MKGDLRKMKLSKRFAILIIALLVITTLFLNGCSLLQGLKKTSSCLKKVNIDYDVHAEIGANFWNEEEERIADNTDAIGIALFGLIINDAMANDFERCLLHEAGILAQLSIEDSKVIKASIGDDVTKLFSNKFKTRITDAIAEKKDEIDGAIAKEKGFEPEDGVYKIGIQKTISEIREGLLKKICEEAEKHLKAKYKVKINVKAQSFDFKLQTFQYKNEIYQSSLADFETTSKDWKQLLFRGKSVDIVDITLILERTSLISEALQKGMDELKDSTFFEDTLMSVFAGASYNVLGNVGKAIGSRIDKKIYRLAKKRYGPTFEMGKSSFDFMTKLGNATPYSNALKFGKRELRLIAHLKDKADKEVPFLITNLVTFPLRTK